MAVSLTGLCGRRSRAASLVASVVLAGDDPKVERTEPGSKLKFKLVYPSGYIKYVDEVPPGLKPGGGAGDGGKDGGQGKPGDDGGNAGVLPFHPMKVAPTEDLPDDKREQFHERLKDYELDVVSKNPQRARDIATQIAKGISDTADICKINPPICKQNKGIKRDSMPQLLDDPLSKLMESHKESDKKKAQAAIDAGADVANPKSQQDQFLDFLEGRGVKVNRGRQVEGGSTEYEKVPVGKLKATQSEIKADKTYSMADSYLRGFKSKEGVQMKDFTKPPIIVSRDNYILDGHHRWSAMLVANPAHEMNVVRVDMDMDDMLCASMEMPGVFRADKSDNVIPNDAPSQLDCPQQRAAAISARVSRVFEQARIAERIASDLRLAM